METPNYPVIAKPRQYIDDKVYALRECQKHLSVSKELDNKIPKAQKKIYVPPMSHL